MGQLEVGYVLMALNPFGGPFIAIPLAMWKMHWPVALAVALTTVLAFTQVLVVEFGWSRLAAWPRFVEFVEAKRSDKLTGYLESRWAPLWIALIGPWFGPWIVMALARFSAMPFRRVGPALFVGLFYICSVTGGLCLYAPDLLPAKAREYIE